jgi:hypothetical protein
MSYSYPRPTVRAPGVLHARHGTGTALFHPRSHPATAMIQAYDATCPRLPLAHGLIKDDEVEHFDVDGEAETLTLLHEKVDELQGSSTDPEECLHFGEPNVFGSSDQREMLRDLDKTNKSYVDRNALSIHLVITAVRLIQLLSINSPTVVDELLRNGSCEQTAGLLLAQLEGLTTDGETLQWIKARVIPQLSAIAYADPSRPDGEAYLLFDRWEDRFGDDVVLGRRDGKWSVFSLTTGVVASGPSVVSAVLASLETLPPHRAE